MKRSISRLWHMFLMPLIALMTLFADSAMTTVVSEGAGLSKFSDLIRAVYSKEIEFKALPIMRFLQFATVKTELGVQPGLTISMLTYDNLTPGGALTEATRMTTQALSGSLKSITVGERGNAIAVTELALQSSFDDILSKATNLLARDYALVLDMELRDVALSGTNVIYGRDKTSATPGTKVTTRANIAAASTMDVATVKDGVEILATNLAPKFIAGNGQYYICFVHPHQSRNLRDDSAWINASNYGAPTQLFTGEIGMIDDVRFIETTLMCNGACAATDPAYKAALKHGASGAPAAVDVYQAVMFGESYYGLARALPMEMRDGGIIDFGREHGIAWYGIWGSGKLHDQYGVVIETA